MTILFSFLIGVLNGLRAFTAPAAVAWAARLGWLHLEGKLAYMGSTIAVVLFTLGALVEYVMDKLPTTPARTEAPGLISRIVMGGLTGACISSAGGQGAALGTLLGAAGGVVGCFGGYQLRTRLVKALKVPDFVIAVLEDLVTIAGSLWVASRFS